MDIKLPKLETLLEEPTTFVLGAGASKDYGFPLWDDLRRQVIEFLNDNELVNDHPEKSYWINIFTSSGSNDKTLDQLAAEAAEKNDDAYYLFQFVVSHILTEYEANSHPEGTHGWIEVLTKRLLQILRDQRDSGNNELLLKTMGNLKFITLNYDRVFDVRFQSKIEEKMSDWSKLKYRRELGNNPSWPGYILHPHGSIGGLTMRQVNNRTYINNGGDGYIKQLSYGDVQTLESYYKKSKTMVSPLGSVDDLVRAKFNPAYNDANSILKKTKNCLCIGLSKEGIINSKLELNTIENIYFSGKKDEVPDGYENFIPLSMYAMEIAEAL